MGTLTKIKFLDHETHDSSTYKIIVFFSFHQLHKITITHVIMKTEPSYPFQHSLLTREVFIMVLGHSQFEDFFFHKQSQIGNTYV